MRLDRQNGGWRLEVGRTGKEWIRVVLDLPFAGLHDRHKSLGCQRDSSLPLIYATIAMGVPMDGAQRVHELLTKCLLHLDKSNWHHKRLVFQPPFAGEIRAPLCYVSGLWLRQSNCGQSEQREVLKAFGRKS
jgi:hypothetical protein